MLDACHDASVATDALSTDAPRAGGSWLCAHCGQRVTHEIYLATVDGASSHSRSNPHGQTFSFRTFALAPGGRCHGEPTREATWFPPRAWQYLHCARCATHLGWCFAGRDVPRCFALINSRLHKEQDR